MVSKVAVSCAWLALVGTHYITWAPSSCAVIKQNDVAVGCSAGCLVRDPEFDCDQGVLQKAWEAEMNSYLYSNGPATKEFNKFQGRLEAIETVWPPGGHLALIACHVVLMAWLVADALLVKYGKNQVALSNYVAALWMIPSFLSKVTAPYDFAGWPLQMPFPWTWSLVAVAAVMRYMAKNDLGSK
jgi:hypothetical protein